MNQKFHFVFRAFVITVTFATFVSAVGVLNCTAQWGIWGPRSPWGASRSVPAGAFQYRGPLVGIEIVGGFAGPSVYSQYRGVAPTQAELDRERFYSNLDRTHRYQTREDRYENDFFNAYASPSAMVNRYRDPYVAGSPSVPVRPLPVPGLAIGRYQSSYQGYVEDDTVAISLRAAANRLKRSLSRMADGHIWIRHLKPDQIIDSIDRAQHPAMLSDLIINYEGVDQNPRLVLIASAEGFQDVRRLLSQYVTLQSPYPNAIGMETIVDEQLLGEQVIDEQVIIPSDDTVLMPPSLAEPVLEGRPQIDAGTSPPSRREELPDSADIELLPAPLPTPADEQ
jgi:hypothetical protein